MEKLSWDFALGRLIADKETLQTRLQSPLANVQSEESTPLGGSEILWRFQCVSYGAEVVLELGLPGHRVWFFLTQQGWHCSM